jgi:hypothetical protein
MLAVSFWALYAEDLAVTPRAALGGLGLGLTALVRPEVLPFSALILGGSPPMIKGFTRRAAALGLAVFLAIASLWVARNALVFHRFVPVSTIGAYSRYLGLRLPLEHQPIDIGPFHKAPDGLDELSRDADYIPAFRELRDKTPLIRRANGYVFNLLTVYYPFLPQYDWTYALLVPFWVCGLWLALSRRELWPAAGLVAGLSVVFAFLAGPVSRYRFGFSPCLILLAGAGAQELRERFGAKKFSRAAGSWAAFNLFIWLAAGPLRQAVLSLKAALLR